MIVNLLSDIDGTTSAISGTNNVVHGTNNVDCNSPISIGTKDNKVPTESYGMCNCINNPPLISTILHAIEKNVQHGTNGTFQVVLREPPAKQLPQKTQEPCAPDHLFMGRQSQ